MPNLDLKKMSVIQQKVEGNSRQLEEIVDNIVTPYSKDLDKYVRLIKDILADENPPTDGELEDFCMNLSTYIYFAGAMCEQLGIKDDISKAIWKEVYNTNRDGEIKGTVADKNTIAELASQQEYLINVCYQRAYKILKSKVENAQELLQSCKKVLSRRMQEQALTQIGGN